MRTTVVDTNAKLMVTNGVVHVHGGSLLFGDGDATMSIHAWLKRHMEDHPAGRYELVFGSKTTIELEPGDPGRPDLSQMIIGRFDEERMNFGEEVRIRLITTSVAVQQPPTPPKAEEVKPLAPTAGVPERELKELIAMRNNELDAIVEQWLLLKPWKVIIAYAELDRRLQVINPSTVNHMHSFAKCHKYEDPTPFIDDEVRKLGYESYSDLWSKLNETTPAQSRSAVPSRPVESRLTSSTAKDSSRWYKKWYVWVLICLGLMGAIVERIEESAKGKKHASDCIGKEGNLRNYEMSRIGRIGNMQYVSEPEIQSIGSCKYKILSNVMDLMYGSQYNIIMTYEYDINGEWIQVGNESYKSINGEWVRQ
jgi:hypothetical protein